jgi:exopolysaccharide biosynthesis protein
VHPPGADRRRVGVCQLSPSACGPEEELPLVARTTSEFLREFDLQLAVNGNGFEPWRSNTILDYYPHSGDRIAPTGYATSEGTAYAKDNGAGPVLYFAPSNRARFNNPTGKIDNAISGNLMLVVQGKPVVSPGKGQPNADAPEPRTALGLDKSGRHLIIVVVDGRQPGYSQGATLEELAQICLDQGANFAMNMDGGGSTTLVAEGRRGAPRTLNSPINHNIPGWERPVGNHLGVYAGWKD